MPDAQAAGKAGAQDDARAGAEDDAQATASPDAADSMSPDLTTCATSPPQYNWIFKGACGSFTLKPTGGSFSLGSYNNITVKGSLG